jgi:hypothetical protein
MVSCGLLSVTAQSARSTLSRMADDDSTQANIVIPDELQKKFPDLIELILGSESMNDDERQYWVNILPVMTPDQIEELKRILANERNQLAAIDKKYTKEVDKLGAQESIAQTEKEREEKRTQRSKAETAARKEEEENVEDILGKIEGV